MRYLGFPQANFLKGELYPHPDGLRLNTPLFGGLVKPAQHAAVTAERALQSRDISVGIRPEHVLIGKAPPGHVDFQAKVLLREDLGGEEIVYLDANGLQLTTVVSANDSHALDIKIDQMVRAHAAPEHVVVYADGGYVGNAV
jgi:ABC-type sugar transport system ATPase subunit